MFGSLKFSSVSDVKSSFSPELQRRRFIASFMKLVDRAMLSNALLYLDERRRRLQRADTAPLIHLSTSPTDPGEEMRSCESGSRGLDNVLPFELPSDVEPQPIRKMSAAAVDANRPARMTRISPSKRRSSTPPLKLRHRVQVSPDGSRKTTFRKTVSLERRTSLEQNINDDSSKLRQNTRPSNRSQKDRPQKFNKHLFVRQLKRYNSARTIEDLRKEWGSTQKIIRDTSELFTAIERSDLNMVKMILERHPDVLHASNDFDLYPLDMAMMRSRGKVAEYLISVGASNNPNYNDPKALLDHLAVLIDDNDNRQRELALRFRDGSATQMVEKEVTRVEQALVYLKQLKTNLVRMSNPTIPSKVTLDMVSANCVRVKVAPPVDCTVTKFKIEWSTSPNFETIDGQEMVSVKLPQTSTDIFDLEIGKCYYFRASALNMKGWGNFRPSKPSTASLVTWRSDRMSLPLRYKTSVEDLSSIKNQIDELSKDWLTGKAGNRGRMQRTKSPKLQRKRSFKHFFFNGIKFTGNPKSGVFLCLMCHCENKVLIHEDQLPYMFVDEVQSFGSLPADVVWLMKFLSNEDDMKQIRDQFSKVGLPSRLNFRMTLISCLIELQLSLGLNNFRVMYPEIVRRNDAAFIVLIKEVNDPKIVTLSSGLKWSSIDKMMKKSSTVSSLSSDSVSRESSSISMTHEENTSIQDYLKFSSNYGNKLEDGLYVAYVRLNCQVDYLELMVPKDRPSLPPIEKIRNNFSVTLEEWQTFKRSMHLGNGGFDRSLGLTDFQCKFRKSFLRAWSNLCDQLKMSCDEISEARVYTDEIIEIAPSVSLILVFPSADKVCMAPGTEYLVPSEDFSFIPLRIHEALYPLVYENENFTQQSALSSYLEMLLPLAQQSQREAFSNSEIMEAKSRTELLINFQNQIESLSTHRRWLVDAITCARDKGDSLGRMVPLSSLLFAPANPNPEFLNNNCPELSDIECSLNMKTPSSVPSPGLVKEFNQIIRSTSHEDETIPAMGTMRLFADYPTGLAEGTSVKLFLTAKTTAREILYLVVRQLNMAGQLKSVSSPIYTSEKMCNFQLVGIKGDDSEVVMPHDLHPLLLDSSWKKARFCIRLKNH